MMLDTIKTEIENFDLSSLPEPTTEVGKGEHIVGELDPSLRRLYGLIIQWVKIVAENMLAAGSEMDKQRREEYVNKAMEFERKAELVKDIFWCSVNESFKLWTMDTTGIRKGWKIVWCDQPPSEIKIFPEETFPGLVL